MFIFYGNMMTVFVNLSFLFVNHTSSFWILYRWPTKMSKMNEGKTAENGMLMISPNCRNYFGQFRKNVENLET